MVKKCLETKALYRLKTNERHLTSRHAIVVTPTQQEIVTFHSCVKENNSFPIVCISAFFQPHHMADVIVKTSEQQLTLSYWQQQLSFSFRIARQLSFCLNLDASSSTILNHVLLTNKCAYEISSLDEVVTVESDSDS